MINAYYQNVKIHYLAANSNDDTQNDSAATVRNVIEIVAAGFRTEQRATQFRIGDTSEIGSRFGCAFIGNTSRVAI